MIALAVFELWHGINPMGDFPCVNASTLCFFIKLNRSAEELEPEAMAEAKREDQELDIDKQ